jgi:flavodoxin
MRYDDEFFFVAYYSRIGNTRIVAEYIHHAIGGDI